MSDGTSDGPSRTGDDQPRAHIELPPVDLEPPRPDIDLIRADVELIRGAVGLSRADPAGISPITRSERRAAEAAAAAEAAGPGHFPSGYGQFVWALIRIALGLVFLWAFLDKLFGLGRSTPAGRSWIDGGSPTTAYLSSVNGPFDYFFNQMAGQAWADWLFMIGLAGIGLALVLGAGVVVAALTGVLLLVFMWMASLPIATNPFLDDHLIYALVIVGIAATGAGLRYSLAPWWRRTALVRKLPLLR